MTLRLSVENIPNLALKKKKSFFPPCSLHIALLLLCQCGQLLSQKTQ